MSAAEAVKAVLMASARRIQLFKPPYAGAKMGQINGDEFVQEARMFDYKIGDLSGYFTNDLIDDINTFDAAKIAADARAYAG